MFVTYSTVYVTRAFAFLQEIIVTLQQILSTEAKQPK